MPSAPFLGCVGQTHVNGWSRVVASQNGGSTCYIFPFRLRVLLKRSEEVDGELYTKGYYLIIELQQLNVSMKPTKEKMNS